MQYTYSPENSFVVKNPEMARGGVFWNTHDRYVEDWVFSIARDRVNVAHLDNRGQPAVSISLVGG